MLTSLRIQNFRSIRDASVKLGQVNLFIGPNNSGKSNFLKGIEYFTGILQTYQDDLVIPEDFFLAQLFRDDETFTTAASHWAEIAFLAKGELSGSSFNLSIQLKNNSTGPDYDSIYRAQIAPCIIWKDVSSPKRQETFSISIAYNYINTKIYNFEPATFKVSSPITIQNSVSSNGDNLVAFIFQLSQNYRSRFSQLEADLANCVGGLVAISTPADPLEAGKFKLRFFNQNDVGYWADEVSEGVLYFLALLCIVHQPDPPKLLLLEEPEKGIHPRRIKEVMDFIFELARLRDIQIILTSHSPYVVDHFKDIPECISVFDREDGETVIHNAADIIKETNEKLEAAGQKPIRYTDALGEYWVSGFLGGVPL